LITPATIASFYFSGFSTREIIQGTILSTIIIGTYFLSNILNSMSENKKFKSLPIDQAKYVDKKIRELK
jgi:predicted secreted protein